MTLELVGGGERLLLQVVGDQALGLKQGREAQVSYGIGLGNFYVFSSNELTIRQIFFYSTKYSYKVLSTCWARFFIILCVVKK
jgi:hypothetical protein